MSKWKLNAANRTTKSQVLQIFYHAGDGMRGVNPAFRVMETLARKGGKRKIGKRGFRDKKIKEIVHENSLYSTSYVKALFSFKNIKSIEAAVEIVKRRRIIRIFEAVWTEDQGNKLKRHSIVKDGKLKIH